MRCVLFDFDGTLTDVERHAPRYEDAYRDELARRAGVGRAVLDAVWAEATVDADDGLGAGELGWLVDGRVVAPARADPYLFTNTVARLTLARAGWLDERGAAHATYEAYRAAYRHVPPCFRDDAGEVLDALVARGLAVGIVTNSHAEDVAAKLEAVPLRAATRAALDIRGDARKFQLGPPELPDPRFDALPEETRLDGLARPVLLRRGRYFDALRSIWDAHAAGPATTLVCGDVYELDLALPHALGAAVHLLAHARTLAHERRAAEARGAVTSRLSAVLERVTA